MAEALNGVKRRFFGRCPFTLLRALAQNDRGQNGSKRRVQDFGWQCSLQRQVSGIICSRDEEGVNANLSLPGMQRGIAAQDR